MTGGILQLVAKGTDDMYIINKPQITYFKCVYRRYSNFSIDNKILRFNKNVGFDSKGFCELKKYGDLLHKLILVIDLPEIEMIYQSLTNQDVQKILYDIGVIWTYLGNPTDKVTKEQLQSIKLDINNTIIEIQKENLYLELNNIIPLENLSNYYEQNTDIEVKPKLK